MVAKSRYPPPWLSPVTKTAPPAPTTKAWAGRTCRAPSCRTARPRAVARSPRRRRRSRSPDPVPGSRRRTAESMNNSDPGRPKSATPTYRTPRRLTCIRPNSTYLSGCVRRDEESDSKSPDGGLRPRHHSRRRWPPRLGQIAELGSAGPVGVSGTTTQRREATALHAHENASSRVRPRRCRRSENRCGNLAKVGVASSNPVVRSRSEA